MCPAPVTSITITSPHRRQRPDSPGIVSHSGDDVTLIIEFSVIRWGCHLDFDSELSQYLLVATLMFSNWSKWLTLGSVYSVQCAVQWQLYMACCTPVVWDIFTQLNSLDWDISFQRLNLVLPDRPPGLTDTRHAHHDIRNWLSDQTSEDSATLRPQTLVPSLPRLVTSVNFPRVNSGWNVLECEVWELETEGSADRRGQ